MWCPRASIYAFRSYCGGDVVYSGVSGGWFGSPMVVGPGQLGGAPRDHGGAAGHAGSLFRWCLSQVSTAGSLLLGGPFCAAGWGAFRAKAMVTTPSGIILPIGALSCVGDVTFGHCRRPRKDNRDNEVSPCGSIPLGPTEGASAKTFQAKPRTVGRLEEGRGLQS